MQSAQAALLPDGRLHLHHGPIDLIIDAVGAGRDAAFQRASKRFADLLPELVGNLSELRRTSIGPDAVAGNVAKSMVSAVSQFEPTFVTPMAAVAGAVAEEILSVLVSGSGLSKAYVNNGGDVALFLEPGEQFDAAITGAGNIRLRITSDMAMRGLATSGWKGRSHSLGISDSVTVLAKSAAIADVAATLIANAVDIPDHPHIGRTPATDLSPDSDLGLQLVTVAVPLLNENERAEALQRGLETAQDYLSRSLICGAFLLLQGESREISAQGAQRLFLEMPDA